MFHPPRRLLYTLFLREYVPWSRPSVSRGAIFSRIAFLFPSTDLAAGHTVPKRGMMLGGGAKKRRMLLDVTDVQSYNQSKGVCCGHVLRPRVIPRTKDSVLYAWFFILRTVDELRNHHTFGYARHFKFVMTFVLYLIIPRADVDCFAVGAQRRFRLYFIPHRLTPAGFTRRTAGHGRSVDCVERLIVGPHIPFNTGGGGEMLAMCR